MTKIKLQNISKSFDTFSGKIDALKNINLQIQNNECVVIAGENGSGKSVLMSIIANLEKKDDGIIEYFDENGKVQKKRKIGLIFQEAETQILGETPKEDVSFGIKNLKINKNEIENLTKISLKKTNLLQKADFPSRFLSGGEKRRLAVSCMIALQNDVLIFDEPYANLDFCAVKQVNQLITQLLQEKKTIIILTHELEKCLGLANHFIVLNKGEIVFDGKPNDGLKLNLEQWNIKNPLTKYENLTDLIW